jgi:predicted Zn-dependent peptidase
MKVVCGTHGSPKVTIKVVFSAGSALEYNKYKLGLAHFVEHMVYQESSTMDPQTLADAMAFLGADWNASTYHNKVSYYVNVPSENAFLAARYLSEMILNRKFSYKYFEQEKNAILSEKKQDDNDMYFCLSTRSDEILFKGPYAIPIIGTSKSIESISLKDVQKFYDKYYQSQYMLLSIVGPEGTDFNSIISLFGENDDALKVIVVPSKFSDITRHSEYVGATVASIYLFYKGLPVSKETNVLYDLLDYILCVPSDSRLYKSLRLENGLCYSVNGSAFGGRDIGGYLMWVDCDKKKTKKLMHTVNKELKTLQTTLLTDYELQKIKNRAISSLYSYIETSYGFASFLSNAVFYDLGYGSDPVSGLKDKINSITAKDIQDFAKILFDKKNRQVVRFVPEK